MKRYVSAVGWDKRGVSWHAMNTSMYASHAPSMAREILETPLLSQPTAFAHGSAFGSYRRMLYLELLATSLENYGALVPSDCGVPRRQQSTGACGHYIWGACAPGRRARRLHGRIHGGPEMKCPHAPVLCYANVKSRFPGERT